MALSVQKSDSESGLIEQLAFNNEAVTMDPSQMANEDEVIIDFNQYQLLERLKVMIDKAVKLECDTCHKLIPTVNFYEHFTAQDSEGNPVCCEEMDFKTSISKILESQNVTQQSINARTLIDNAPEEAHTTNWTRANSSVDGMMFN